MKLKWSMDKPADLKSPWQTSELPLTVVDEASSFLDHRPHFRSFNQKSIQTDTALGNNKSAAQTPKSTRSYHKLPKTLPIASPLAELDSSAPHTAKRSTSSQQTHQDPTFWRGGRTRSVPNRGSLFPLDKKPPQDPNFPRD